MSAPSSKSISRDDALAYLHGETFKLQHPDYGDKYPHWPGAVGIEVEMLPVRCQGEKPPAFVPLHDDGGLAHHIRTLAEAHGWSTETTEGMDGTPLLSRANLPTGNLTFEPGGQLEFSSKPYPCLSDALRHLVHAQDTLDSWFKKDGIATVQFGINPWHSLADLGLQMPKHRYLAMDEYYERVSPYGRRMMRQTCTTQVNLDFGTDTPTMVKRYLASQLLSPYATATFANSPRVDGNLVDVPGFRSRVWRHTDPTHTGVIGIDEIAEDMTRDRCIETYLEAVLDATVVFIERDRHYLPAAGFRFRDWMEHGYEGHYPSLSDYKTHLSLMFTEVRPRGFIELRSIDCQSRVWQTVPAFYYCGLLYSDEAVDRVLDLLLPMRGRTNELLGAAERGLADPDLAGPAKKLMAIACDGFSSLPSCFREGNSVALMTAVSLICACKLSVKSLRST